MFTRLLYTALAPAWDRIGKMTGHEREARYFMEALPLPQHDPIAILDLGCGTGIYSRAALERFPEAHLTAIDISPAMIRECRKRAEGAGFHERIACLEGDLRTLLPRFKTSFDLILLGGILEHVEPGTVMPDIVPVLKPGGWILAALIRKNRAGRMLGKVLLFRPVAANIRNVFASHGLRYVKTLRLPQQWKYYPSSRLKEAQFYVKQSESRITNNDRNS